MITARTPPERRSISRPRQLFSILAALAVAAGACATEQDDETPSAVNADTTVEYQDQTGPHVNDPDQAMAMTVDAIDVAGDDILVRLRVENRDDRYLDMGVQNTTYGPLLVMSDDRDNVYESYAVEPAGIPGRRIADLSFRLVGPLDPDAESFTLELATQRGPLTTPSGTLPDGDGTRWLIEDPVADTPISDDTGPSGSEHAYAPAPRLPDLVHFWLETDPLPADR